MEGSNDLIDQILASNEEYNVEYDKSQITTDAVLDSITSDPDIDEHIKDIISKTKITETENKDKKTPLTETTPPPKETKNEQTINQDLEKIKEEQKKREELEKEKERKKQESLKVQQNFIPSYNNPILFVNYLELDRTNNRILKDMNSFLIQNNRKNNNKHDLLEITSYSEISDNLPNNITAMYAKKEYVVFCTNEGSFLLFSLKEKRLVTQITNQKFNGKVINCLDITDDLEFILAGYQDGCIALFNIIKGDCKFDSNKIHKNCACIELKIYKNDQEKGLSFISSGSDGSLNYTEIKPNFLRIITIKQSINILTNETPIFLIKFIRFSEQNEILYSNLNPLKRYAIFGSLNEIRLYSIEPEIQFVSLIPKPEHIKDYVVPDAQIGIAKSPEVNIRFQKKDVKNHLILIISWAELIYVYRLPITSGDTINETIFLGYYVNSCDILRIGFINNSVVYVLDKQYGIKIIDSAKLNPGRPKIKSDTGKVVIPKNNNLAEIDKGHSVSQKLGRQLKITDPKNNKKETFLYSIIENGSSLQILSEKQMYNCKLIEWDTFLNNLQKKEEYLDLFTIGIDLYQEKFNAFSKIPPKTDDRKKKIGEFLRQIVSQYVIFNTGSKKSGSLFLEDENETKEISKCINISIEFCIEIEAIEYLLKSIEPLFETKDYGELFLQKLEPFILCDKIKNVILSEDILLNLIDLYNRNDKLYELGQMLLHLNIKSIDTLAIKTKLEEMNLITPLIYLNMNGQNEDYFAPLNKMFDYFKNKAFSLNYFSDYNFAYDKVINDKKATLKEVGLSKQYYGHKILWYIKLCLNGRKFPNDEKMNENLYKKLVPDITYWLLSEKVIKEFLVFDPKNYFSLHKNIFSIDNLYNKLVESAKDEKTKVEALARLFSDVKIDDIEPLSLIDYLVGWCKIQNKEIIYFYLYDFIICVSKKNNIKKQLREEASSFIMKHYTNIVKNINNQEVNLLCKSIITFLDDKNISSFNEYKNILNNINDHIFDEVKIFLLDKMNEYKQCLELYLSEENLMQEKETKLFKWLRNKLSKMQKTSVDYENFIQNIQKNLLPLAKASIKKFNELIHEIFPNKKKELIDSLESDKNVQLSFVELLIKPLTSSSDENENNINDEDPEEIEYIFRLHIQLLCELNKFDKILPSLKSSTLYPLDECLILCKKYKAYEASVYLFLTTGAPKEALDLCISKMDEIYKNLLNEVKTNNNFDEKLVKDFDKYLNDGKNVCEHNEQQIDDLWFNILEKLYKYENEINEIIKVNKENDKKNNALVELQKKMSQEIKDLMEKMYSFVSIRRIMDFVGEKNKNAGFKEFRELLMKILNSYSHQSKIFASARNLLSNSVLENENNFQLLNRTGELLNLEKCNKCQKEFNKNLNNKEKILVFSCGHNYHLNCTYYINTENGLERVCPKCREAEIEDMGTKKGNSLIKRNTTVLEDKKYENSEFQVNVTFSSQRVLKKLKLYDNRNFEKKQLMIKNSVKALNDQYRASFK